MKGIIINSDADGILKGIGKKGAPPTTAEDILNFPETFEGSQITDYFINVAENLTTFPSERYESYVSKYHQKIENGIPVDYTEGICARGAHIVFDELKVDHNALMIEGFKKVGINPWISFRMNDVHDRRMQASFNLTDFFHEHPEYLRAKHPPEMWMTNSDDCTYDYTVEEVRDYFYGIIEESLERYDCYGIELDFLRDIHMFAIGKDYDGVEILNGFMRRVDALVAKYEKKYGHEFKFAVRVAPDIQTNFNFGLDVMQWVRDGIVDMIILGNHLASVDNDMPIKLWKNLTEPYGTSIVASIDMATTDMGIAPSPGYTSQHNIETVAAFAAHAYAQGADKIYFYNYFVISPHHRFNKNAPLIPDPKADVFWDGNMYWTIMNTVGDPDTVQGMNRRHIITYKDIRAPWESKGGVGRQLPNGFSRVGCFKLFVGDIPENAEVTLRVGVKDPKKAAANPPMVYTNNVKCEYIGTMFDERFAKDILLCYRIPKEAHGNMLCPYFGLHEPTEFTYVEAFIKVSE